MSFVGGGLSEKVIQAVNKYGIFKNWGGRSKITVDDQTYEDEGDGRRAGKFPPKAKGTLYPLEKRPAGRSRNGGEESLDGLKKKTSGPIPVVKKGGPGS